MAGKLNCLIVVSVAALLSSGHAQTTRRRFCFEAPSIANSRCYKDELATNVIDPKEMQDMVFTVGETITYKCLDNFKLVGEATAVCQASGLWTTLPRCDPMPTTTVKTTTTKAASVCQAVPTGTNLACIGNGPFTEGQQVTCSCKDGYKLSSSLNDKATCNNGKWASIPTCVVDSKCSGYPDVGNAVCTGDLGASGTYSPGASVQCTCNVGYKQTGNGKATCSNSGQWTNNPSCAQILCFAAPSISNSECYKDSSKLSPSEMSSTFFPVNTLITYKCLSGYILNGEGSLKCGTDGLWNGGKMPSCDRACVGTAATPANGVCKDSSAAVEGNYKVGTSLECTCNEGFKFSSATANLAKCLSTGSWQLPTCSAIPTTTPVPKCKGTPEFANGQCTVENDDGSRSYSKGAKATCTCSEGFQISSSTKIATTTCAGTTWNKITACTEIPSCAALPAITNGACARTDTATGAMYVGTTVTCNCESGFAFGTAATSPTSQTVNCKSKNTWSAAVSCQAIKTTTTKATTTTKPTTTTVYKNCPAPPQIDGTGCANCGAGETVPNGSGPTVPPGTIVTYQCRSDYKLTGSARITCQKDGTWSELPLCTLITTTTKAPTTTTVTYCPKPTSIPGAGCTNCENRAIPIFILGDEVRYQCASGYQYAPGENGIITCLAGGVWSKYPTCVPVPAATTPKSDSNSGSGNSGDGGSGNNGNGNGNGNNGSGNSGGNNAISGGISAGSGSTSSGGGKGDGKSKEDSSKDNDNNGRGNSNSRNTTPKTTTTTRRRGRK